MENPLSIDLDSTEGRKQYLSEKLDDLLDGINESYGTLLMEELIARLELTVKDFNEEMKSLCDQLVKKQEERQNLLEMIKSNDEMISKIKSTKTSISDINLSSDATSTKGINQEESMLQEKLKDDIPLWEKKLAKLEKK